MKAAINDIISMCVFLMIGAPVNDGQLSMSYLDSEGLFSVEICKFVENKVVFIFPDSVPLLSLIL